jgi:hypothetical protein
VNTQFYFQHSFEIVARRALDRLQNFLPRYITLITLPALSSRVNQTEEHQLPTPQSQTGKHQRSGLEIASLHISDSLRDRRSRFVFPLRPQLWYLLENKVLFRRSHHLDLNELFQSTTSTIYNLNRYRRFAEQTARQPLQSQITNSSLLHT